MIVLPRYGEASLADIVPSILGALGVSGEENVLGLPSAGGYCLLLVDGLGWNLLRAHPAQTPFLSSLTANRLTSGAPSTTATSLASLGTGLPPGRHGLVGYTSRYPGRDEIFNALSWTPPVDPETYQPYPNLFERADRSGVATRVLGRRRFRQSGLTRAALRGPFHGADSYGERIAAAVDGSSVPGPSLVYVYDSDLDHAGHQVGCGSAAWRHQLVIIDRVAEELYDALPDDTVLLVTGDHGMVDVDPADRIDVGDRPALRDGVTLIAGEARFRHLYTADGAAEDVVGAWRSTLGKKNATVLTRQDAVDAGWFGAVENRVLDRIGDVVVNVHGRCAVEHREVFPAEARMVGLHGALSEDEVYVPLLTSL